MQITQTQYLSILFVIFILALALLFWLLKRRKNILEPKEGKPVGAGVAVFYSPDYRMHFPLQWWFVKPDYGKWDKVALSLLEEKLMVWDQMYVPQSVNDEMIADIHSPAYLDSLNQKKTLSRIFSASIPFYAGSKRLQKDILQPMKTISGGTLEASQVALNHGFSINIGGGFIHATGDHGHGACVYNDIAMAIKQFRRNGMDEKIVILNVCARQCDGVNAFYQHDDSVITLSLYYPQTQGEPSAVADIDIPISNAFEDDEYLALVEQHVPEILDRERPFLVYFIAGADVLNDAPVTPIAITEQGLVRRDVYIAGEIRRRGIPLVYLMGTGFGPGAAQAQSRSIRALIQEYFE